MFHISQSKENNHRKQCKFKIQFDMIPQEFQLSKFIKQMRSNNWSQQLCFPYLSLVQGLFNGSFF